MVSRSAIKADAVSRMSPTTTSAAWAIPGSPRSHVVVVNSSCAQPCSCTPCARACHHSTTSPPAQKANAGVRIRAAHRLANSSPSPDQNAVSIAVAHRSWRSRTLPSYGQKSASSVTVSRTTL